MLTGSRWENHANRAVTASVTDFDGVRVREISATALVKNVTRRLQQFTVCATYYENDGENNVCNKFGCRSIRYSRTGREGDQGASSSWR